MWSLLPNSALLLYPLSQFSLIVDLKVAWGKDEDLADEAAKTQREKGVCQ